MAEEDNIEIDQDDVLVTAPRAPSDNPPELELDFVDHFSLKQPSSQVRARGVTTRVYDLANDQLQLEHRTLLLDDEDSTKVQVTMQRLRAANLGLRVLRTFYTMVALLMAGFVFVLACNIIVMQAMEIPRNAGQAAGTSLNVAVMIANLLSLPLLVYSMASLMIFASVFVSDTWNGHVLFSLLVGPKVPRVYVEWYCFGLYLGVPMLVMIFAGLRQRDDFGRVGALAWYACMNFSFLIFSALVFYQEIKVCLDLTRIQYPNLSQKDLVRQAVLTTLIQRFCGREERQYLMREPHNIHANVASLALTDNDSIQPQRTRRSIYSYSTTLSFNPFFERVDPPQPRYSINELRETVPIVTHQSWSLPKMCCQITGNSRSRFAVGGANALNAGQIKSALICNIVGVNLGLLFVASVLYGAGMGTVIILAAVLVGFVFIGIPCMWSAAQLFKVMQSERACGEEDNDATPVYQTWSALTVSKPKEWYCWFRCVVALVFFFLWPVVSMFVAGLPKAGALFLVTSMFTMARQNLDAGSILSEHCSLSKVHFDGGSAADDDDDGNNNNKSEESKAKAMVARARASEVIGKITNSNRIWFWVFVFAVMAAFFVYQGVTSAGTGEDYTTQEGREPIRLIDDFYYPRQNDSMLYPNCQLTNQFAFPGLENTYALDYNLLAGIAYETPNVTNYVLDRWFQGQDVVIEETDFVEQWREDSGNTLEQVSFKLFSFPNLPGIGVLSIRGTETPIDALFNIQLYIGTVLTQVVRALMPFSWIWDSIYPDLLATTTWVASDHLQKSEYYRVTTDFANDLLVNNYTYGGKSFQWLRTTGVSLGGGLALITGAQTDAWGFAYSGPNPTLGRKSFDPPISMQELKEKVINIKPDPDLVSSLGDLVPNHQLVRCRTWPAKVHNCHSFWRIFCEYLYTCGSPPDRSGAYCICVEKWGYPPPVQRGGNLTFEEACDEEYDNLVSELGDIFGDAE